MSDLLQEIDARVKALGGDWAKYTAVGTFLLYVVGYLELRFHLTTLGIGTDLSVLDERYLFAGARFLVYIGAAVPNIVLVALPFVAARYCARRFLPAKMRERVGAWASEPARLTAVGILFEVLVIQLFMRQCFVFSDLLLARNLPAEPRWLVRLLLDPRWMPLYFSALVGACVVPFWILWTVRGAKPAGAAGQFARILLATLAAIQALLLPINYGVLVADKAMPRVATVGDVPLAGDEAWLAWEGKEGVTFLRRSPGRKQRSLLTLPRAEVKRTEIVGYDQIVPTLFDVRPDGAR